jgi:hypothetical protein
MTTNRDFDANYYPRRRDIKRYSPPMRILGRLIQQEATVIVVLIIALILMEIFGLRNLAVFIWELVFPVVLKVVITTAIIASGIIFVESLNTD